MPEMIEGFVVCLKPNVKLSNEERKVLKQYLKYLRKQSDKKAKETKRALRTRVL